MSTIGHDIIASEHLFPHNRRAYDAVMAHFAQGNLKACVIQPCGTGKSYVLAAVAAHFDKVYVIAPNDYVLDQAKSACDKEPVCQSYSLISLDSYAVPTDADLIVFDEMHRMGASMWSRGCERLMAANPDAHILGLTATPERALEQRDMSKEYFDGHVVSNMSLSDAWCEGVLEVPQKYVVGITSMDNIQRDRISKINNSRRLNSEQKKSACAKVINLCRDWALSSGVPSIIRKYWDPNIRKCVVFAPTIAAAESLEPTIREWFGTAGYPVNNIYVAHSESEYSARIISDFESAEQGLNILISVSMLNEGIHPRGVSAAILLRSTISRNMFMQQIGRCFSVGQETAPIIFDFADNITSANSYDEIYIARNRFLREGGYIDDKDTAATDRHKELDTFQIIDTVKSVRELMTEIDKHIADRHVYTFEECKSTALRFSTRTSWKEGDSRTYRYAIAQGWIDLCCSHMRKPSSQITKEDCLKSAKDFLTIKDWQKGDNRIYGIALRRGWHQECTAHMRRRKIRHTKEECAKAALNYQTKKEWKIKDKNTYSCAVRYGWITELCQHMLPRTAPNLKWTFDKCAEALAQCGTKKEFMTKYPSAYAAASLKGWFKELYKARFNKY